MKTGIDLITKERDEHFTKHGRSIKLDVEQNRNMQLAEAAAVLSHPFSAGTPRKRLGLMPVSWDDSQSLKMVSKSYKERLIIAGALIAAELDRLIYLESEQQL